MSWPPLVPGVDELTEAPELGPLHLLDAALLVASNALVAANAELQGEDFAEAVLRHRAIEACLAEASLAHIEALQTLLARYRQCLRERRRGPGVYFTTP